MLFLTRARALVDGLVILLVICPRKHQAIQCERGRMRTLWLGVHLPQSGRATAAPVSHSRRSKRCERRKPMIWKLWLPLARSWALCAYGTFDNNSQGTTTAALRAKPEADFHAFAAKAWRTTGNDLFICELDGSC